MSLIIAIVFFAACLLGVPLAFAFGLSGLVGFTISGLPVEIQSWGHSLAQAANLHLMLANERTPYFEAPMPKNAFEFGMKNGILLDKGKIIAPDGPGLGIKVDWESLAAADFYASVRLEF